jgi:hypothetical protein
MPWINDKNSYCIDSRCLVLNIELTAMTIRIIIVKSIEHSIKTIAKSNLLRIQRKLVIGVNCLFDK